MLSSLAPTSIASSLSSARKSGCSAPQSANLESAGSQRRRAVLVRPGAGGSLRVCEVSAARVAAASTLALAEARDRELATDALLELRGGSGCSSTLDSALDESSLRLLPVGAEGGPMAVLSAPHWM